MCHGINSIVSAKVDYKNGKRNLRWVIQCLREDRIWF